VSNWPPLLNVGERTWDSNGSICRPSDKFNEQRAVAIMKARFPSHAECDYLPDDDPFATIDGKWMHDGVVRGFMEIKSHAGRTMGSKTILNLRKWRSLFAKQAASRVPVVFIAQYEDALAYQNVACLMVTVSHLQPARITDTKSAHRITSTEEVWMIPTDKMHIIEPNGAVIPDQSLAELNEWAHKIQMENAQ
jgi:hypothetical protein